MPNLANPYQSGIAYQLFFNYNMPVVTGIFLGLCSGSPDALYDGGELNAVGYSRQPVGTGFNNWSFILNSGLLYNNNQISFPIATQSWGWISGVNIYAANTNNQIYREFYSSLSIPKEITTNDQFYAPISGISIQIH